MARDKEFYTITVSRVVFKQLCVLARMSGHKNPDRVVSKLVREKITKLDIGEIVDE